MRWSDWHELHLASHHQSSRHVLSGPISRDITIPSLRQPMPCDTFSVSLALPQQGAVPPPSVLHLQRYLRDTPFCNISRDRCALRHQNKHERALRYYCYGASRDLRSIAAGPVRTHILTLDGIMELPIRGIPGVPRSFVLLLNIHQEVAKAMQLTFVNALSVCTSQTSNVNEGLVFAR